MGIEMSKEEERELMEEFIPLPDYDPDDEDQQYHEMTDEEYRIYYEALEKSRGYSVPVFPKALYMNILVPVDLNNLGFQSEVYRCAMHAVDVQNMEKGTKYSFIDVVSAVLSPGAGSNYFITFRVEDLSLVGETGHANVAEDMSLVGEIGNAIDAEDLPRDSEMGNVVAAEDPAEVGGRGIDVVPIVDGGGGPKKVGPCGGPIVEVKANVFFDLPDEQRKRKMEVLEFLDGRSPTQ